MKRFLIFIWFMCLLYCLFIFGLFATIYNCGNSNNNVSGTQSSSFIETESENKSARHEVESTVNKPVDEGIWYKLKELPVLYNGSFKSWMPYTAITNKKSPQYDYIFNKELVKVSKDGLLVTDDGFVGVALGTYFGKIGDKFIFELDDGVKFNAVMLDYKSDAHTDKNGFYTLADKSVIEFVIDKGAARNGAYKKALLTGNFNDCAEFRGRIVKIWKIIDDSS